MRRHSRSDSVHPQLDAAYPGVGKGSPHETNRPHQPLNQPDWHFRPTPLDVASGRQQAPRMQNMFAPDVSAELARRINALTPETTPHWGKMRVDQMLAHCIVAYDMAFTDRHPRPNALVRFLLRTFVKSGVVNETPYARNSRTAPVFVIADRRDFEVEKQQLLDYVAKTQALGAAHFEGKESLSFGPLSAQEWNNLFYKHLDHHLTQFGV